MSAHSGQLQWLILKKRSAFNLKGRTRVGKTFSTETGNVRNVMSARSAPSGTFVSVHVTKSGAAEVLSRSEPIQRKGPFMTRTLVKGGRSKVAAAVEKACEDSNRRNSKRISMTRYRQFHRAQARGTSKKSKK